MKTTIIFFFYHFRMDRRGRGFFFNIGKRLGLTRWGGPGNRFRNWVLNRFGAPGRANDFSCNDLPAAECVAAGFMYRCLGCCLGSDTSALESGCCNVCLFKVSGKLYYRTLFSLASFFLESSWFLCRFFDTVGSPETK
jgi:hypothetical protein